MPLDSLRHVRAKIHGQRLDGAALSAMVKDIAAAASLPSAFDEDLTAMRRTQAQDYIDRPAGRGRQAMMDGRMGGLMLVYAAVWILIVGAVVVALWRGMQAQEKMARHLEAIERSLAERFKAF
jgi:hypothetical protein